jgi:chaperonin cofactor prefoldin
MEQFVLILTLVALVTLISWFFFDKYHRLTMNSLEFLQTRCTLLDDLVKKVEKNLESLKEDIVKEIEKEIDSKMATLSELNRPDHEKTGNSDYYKDLIKRLDLLPGKMATPGKEFDKKFAQIKEGISKIEKQQSQIIAQFELLQSSIKAMDENNDAEDSKLGKEINRPFVDEAIDLNKEINKDKIETDDTELQFEDMIKEIVRKPSLSPHHALIDTLKEFKTEPMVGKILPDLENLESEALPGKLLRELLEIYHYYYQSALPDLASALENILRTKYGVKFNHAKIDFTAGSAVGFEKIKHGEIFRLDEFEKKKVKNKRFDQENKGDIILFELCPQVLIKDKPILQGKIIVS